MVHITWRDEYSVGVKLIDDQHRHFFDILDRAYDCFSSMHGALEMKDVIDQLIEHVHLHFATEEKYFDEFHCAEIAEEEHRARHKEFTEKVFDLKRRYEDGQTDLVADLVELMESWFIQHIMTYDKQYTRCFNEHGVF